MINKFLHALTNRKQLSADPMFVSDPKFLPATLSAGDIALRNALQLNNTGTDYYMRAYAAVLNLFPDLGAIIADDNCSYIPADFLPNGVQSTGGSLVSNQTSSGSYLDLKPVTMPVPMTYVINYESAGTAQLTQPDIGNQLSVSVNVMADANGTILRVQWPEYWPFRGPITLSQAWAPGAQVTFVVEPSRFPYTAAVRALQAIPYFQQLLTNYQLATIFQNTPDVKEKLALVLAAIAISNPAVYPQYSTAAVVAANAAAQLSDLTSDGQVTYANTQVSLTVQSSPLALTITLPPGVSISGGSLIAAAGTVSGYDTVPNANTAALKILQGLVSSLLATQPPVTYTVVATASAGGTGISFVNAGTKAFPSGTIITWHSQDVGGWSGSWGSSGGPALNPGDTVAVFSSNYSGGPLHWDFTITLPPGTQPGLSLPSYATPSLFSYVFQIVKT